MLASCMPDSTQPAMKSDVSVIECFSIILSYFDLELFSIDIP